MNRSHPILVVDDQWPMRQSLAVALREIGFPDVIQAANAQEAMRVLSDQEVAAVISDWNMPGMSGLGLLRWARSRPPIADLPFMLVTTLPDRDHLRQALEAGVSEYLIKPYTVQDLANKVKRMLGAPVVEPLDVAQPHRVLGLMQESEVDADTGSAAVLVVDDVSVNTEMIAAVLEPHYRVLAADSGRRALELARATPAPDLILLDIVMPDMDGYEVCRQLKADPGLRDIPVIFLTGNDTAHDVVQGLELGAVDYLAKPVEPAVLMARLRTQLRLKAAMANLARQNAALAASAKLREDVARITQHDLKNPIASIISATDVLLYDASLAVPQIELIRMIQDEAWRALDQVNQSLNLYRMETGTFVLRAEPVDLLHTLNNVQRELTRALSERAPRFVTADEDGEPMRAGLYIVSGEPGLCHSLFGNLLRNAAEASPPGAAVGITAERGEGVVRIVIRNQGMVPPSVRERFFDKYVTAGKPDGTGLGTYSAKLVTEAQRGSIAMHTDAQVGTTVTVTLPAVGGA